MGYSATTGVVLYWKPYQIFIIHRAHHVCFDEYNSRFSIEYKHTPGSLLLWQDPEGCIHDAYLLNLIPCELDLTSTPFSDESIITYDIELPPSGNKIDFNLLDDDFLQSLTSLILSLICQLFINFHHRLREIFGL